MKKQMRQNDSRDRLRPERLHSEIKHALSPYLRKMRREALLKAAAAGACCGASGGLLIVGASFLLPCRIPFLYGWMAAVGITLMAAFLF